MPLEQSQLLVPTLGPRVHRSPLPMSTVDGDGVATFVPDETRLAHEPRYRAGEAVEPLGFEGAGAREQIFFDPVNVRAAIVTCGGLCPGLNNVIRTLVFELIYNYGIREVLGIRFGYQGLNPKQGRPPIRLSCESVGDIHHQGGTILGTSRGPQDPATTVDFLESQQINILFCIGGDGTQKGAHAIAAEVKRRNRDIAIVGIPKTIDNDIRFCFRTFGFFTAVAEAEKVIDRAHVESRSVLGGVGLVKLMGRDAGFIAAAATLASGEANFCIIPEAPIDLDGPSGFLARLKKRLKAREHAVVVIAEGAGQQWFDDASDADASGNRKLRDCGVLLKQKIEEYLHAESTSVSVKYFDPSYYIRSLPATAVDSLLCERFARAAVHAAIAGKTDMFIGIWHNHLIHVPMKVSTGMKKRLSTESDLWNSVLALTGQEKWKD
ncbi:ATP-dependent 6-phosphofructokinase [Pirellulales bacterium]|nr:ATP-dependent 6-phosphofructokinase [Pirellulales bacterium]